MSAIAGLIRLDGGPVDRASLQRMQNLLAPYGRDAQGIWQQPGAGLLHTLLRITPEDSFDRQPLQDPASQTVLAFDGRIDNREDLTRDLGLSAAEAACLADSALVLRACLRWDTDVAKHLLGDFALACWQPQRRRLWLARDPLGHRPLFWCRQDGLFAFATLPKALFAVPGISRELCEERLHDFICLLPATGPQSFYKNVYRVEPGQALVLEGGRIETRRFHTFDPKRELHLPSDGDYLEAFREHLQRALDRHLRSRGPVASHLSSGFDSATVTALAARRLGEQGKDLLAYTAVPREGYLSPAPNGRHADEGPGAAALARRFSNIEHVLWRSDGRSPLERLQADTEAADCAMLNPCNMVWVDGIQEDAAQRGAKVLLTGTMGNMTISYTGETYLPALLRKGRLAAWWREASALNKSSSQHHWKGLLGQSLGPYVPSWLWAALQRYRGRQGRFADYTALHPRFIDRMKRRARDVGWDLNYRPWSDGRRMRIAVLNRMDNGEHQAAANAAGLEVRDPTADLQLLEFCLAIPDHQYLRDGQTRWLLHRLMGDVLPPEILHGRTKGLQAADWHEGASADLQQLRDELTRMKQHGPTAGYLDLDSLARSLDDWPQGGWNASNHTETYRLKLLRGMAIGTFIRYVEDNNQ